MDYVHNDIFDHLRLFSSSGIIYNSGHCLHLSYVVIIKTDISQKNVRY